jgi:hypothetical protein
MAERFDAQLKLNAHRELKMPTKWIAPPTVNKEDSPKNPRSKENFQNNNNKNYTFPHNNLKFAHSGLSTIIILRRAAPARRP